MNKMKKQTIAFIYDFDKTLCSANMQDYSFIPNMGMEHREFWDEVSALSENQQMDRILAYLYLMIDKSNLNKRSIRREDFVKLGSSVEYYPGVETWFSRIDAYADEIGVSLEHYIISSGLKEIIEGTGIQRHFKKIFACEFLYDHNGIAVWPKNAVNYTTKTQFLFRINKGVLDIANDGDLNRFTPNDKRPVPFRNMIYIGDGFTDVPCMKLVKANGGQSIAVYESSKDIGNELIDSKRVDFVTLADYTKGSELELIIKLILSKMIAVEKLVNIHRDHKFDANGVL